MDEKVKDKDADPAQGAGHDDLQKGLEDTFPASDPISPLQPSHEKTESDGAETGQS